MKKAIVWIICLSLVLALTGCGGKAEEKKKLEPAEAVAKILEMKDQPVEDLYDLVGEPNSSEYSSSCLVMGGKDGQLFYDGFTVYTLVQPDGTETIYDAICDAE